VILQGNPSAFKRPKHQGAEVVDLFVDVFEIFYTFQINGPHLPARPGGFGQEHDVPVSMNRITTLSRPPTAAIYGICRSYAVYVPNQKTRT